MTAYLGSENFLSMAESSRERWRSRCDDIRRKYGIANLESLSARHIKKDLASFEGHAANNRLKVWRSLCAYWDQVGQIETNVARQVAPRKTPKTEGHLAWTKDDFAAFRAHWPIGSKQRLAFELLYRTCAAIGDVAQLHRGMVGLDGWLTYTRQKSGSVATCPFHVDGPSWFEATDDLAKCLKVEPAHMTFLTTESGKSRSAKSVASWFSKSATQAGLDPAKTAHGVRKGRAAVFKENGALAEQRMAVLGHETLSETQHYSKSADLKRTIQGTEKFQLSEQVPTAEIKTLKFKGKGNV
ncbi:MAG: tyrosine-type recombinase/integrase [Pseudomonadota bacterium]